MSMYDLGVGKHTMTCVVTRGGVKEEALPLGQQAGSRVLTRWCAEVAASLCLCLFDFFFSSRRRHTRCLSDWSSDVCSSDLVAHVPAHASEIGQDVAALDAAFFRRQILGEFHRAVEPAGGFAVGEAPCFILRRQDRKSVV